MKDVNAEYSVVAGIMKYGITGLAEIRDIVAPTSFTELKARTIFDLLTVILESQDKVDAATLISKSSSMKVSHIVDAATLQNLFNTNIEFDSLRNLGKKVKKLEIIRGAKHAAQEAFLELDKLNGDEPLSKILGALENKIFAYSNSIGQDDEGVKLLFKDVEEYVKELEDSPCDIVGISTSFPTLDEAFGGGMRRGSVTLIGARSGVGKSMLGAAMARYNASLGIPVLILDTEMSDRDNIQRYLAAQSKITLDSISKGTFGAHKELKCRMWDAVDSLKNLPIYYKNIAGMSFDEIISLCRRWLVMEVGVKGGKCEDCLIVYDYFKLTDSQQLKSLSEHEALGYQITNLTEFCQKYGATALTFVQLNRQGITIEDMSAISQSDRLNWLASNVAIFKNKDEDEIKECGEKWGNSKLIPLKCRFGPGMKEGDCIYTQKLGQYSIIQECGTRSDMLREKHDQEDDGEEDSD